MNFLPNPSAQGKSNLMVAVIICLAILLGFEYLKPRPETPATAPEAKAPSVGQTAAMAATNAAVSPAVSVDNPSYIEGQQPLATLQGFTIQANGNLVPTHEASAIVPAIELAWNALPKGTVWQLAESETGTAITAQANGATFTRRFFADTTGEGLTVTEHVQAGENALALTHTTTLPHLGEQLPGEKSSWVNYFGPLAVLDGKRYEEQYNDLAKRSLQLNAANGFAGFTSRYLMAAVLLQNQNAQVTQRSTLHTESAQRFVTEVTSPVIAVQPNTNATLTRTLYIGDKSRAALAAVDENLADAVHFGWFHSIALPIYKGMVWVHERTGSVIIAILAITLLLKLITLPLTWKSTAAMGKMKMLQPKMKHLQERYKDDRAKLSAEMMKLYQTEKVNPFGGCWPVLIQIPLFFAMYKVILIGHMFKGEPFLWIADIATRDPLFILPVVMGVAMYFQMKLNPQAGADPIQRQMMTFMPIIMTALFLFFPAALMIYWIANTVLSIAQQVVIYQRLGYYKKN